MRIIFMGNPGFAVPSLKALHEAGYDIAAVITGPDKPAGRGLKIQYSPVKEYAITHGLQVLQPEKLKSAEFIAHLKSLDPDLGVVIAFRMLPEEVWNLPRLGTINLHASLLPQYRGAAPINWAIMNGEKETGLTTFFLKHEIDTGDLIFSEKISIGETEDAGSLHDRMMETGAQLMLRTVDAIRDNTVVQKPQESSADLKTAPKIFKKDCLLDFSLDTFRIYNKIRGLSPYPTAYTLVGDKSLKVYSASKEIGAHSFKPGTFIPGKQSLKVATADGFIHLLEVQPEGKKRMGIVEFMNGYASWFTNAE